MSDTIFPFSEERGIAEMKLWSAVIANTILEWIHGSARMQREAEEFLLRDEADFPTVCCSAFRSVVRQCKQTPHTFRNIIARLAVIQCPVRACLQELLHFKAALQEV